MPPEKQAEVLGKKPGILWDRGLGMLFYSNIYMRFENGAQCTM